ncbi:MAG: GspH/FimT family pseudopilin [Tepidanaerobacteraceae bacterium]|jgi:prepilin-type N-terminal cleavage/methylation domain-containing protein|nr:prepilin-type N-terminal cleavage/methylation domain-containing protein [Thermoanaerobacterales bacterium]
MSRVKVFTHKGFSLIEVILVIALLGLLSTLIFPNFKGTLDKYKLEVAAQELAQNIRLAQQKSITEDTSYKILLGKNNYQLLSGVKGNLFELPLGVSIEWTTYYDLDRTIVFHPSGAPNRGGTICLAGNDNRLYVIVSIATGRIRIGDTPP